MVDNTPIAPSETFRDLRLDISPPIEEASAQDAPKRRGRPPGSKSAKAEVKEQPPEIIPPQVIADGAEMVFDILAKRKGEHWRLEKKEKENIGLYTTKVLSKWSPLWLAKYGDEIALATVLGMAIATRMLIDAKLKAEAEPTSKVESADAPAPLYSPGRFDIPKEHPM